MQVQSESPVAVYGSGGYGQKLIQGVYNYG